MNNKYLKPNHRTITNHFLKQKGGMANMTDIQILKSLLRIIKKWMKNKKTGSLQINFIKGEISNVFENRAISLKKNENRVKW